MNMVRLVIIALITTNLVLLGIRFSRPVPELQPTEQESSADNESLPSIVLLSELADDQSNDSGVQCFTVGPFETSETAGAIAGLLEDHASVVGQRQTEAFVDRGFWVYVPPLESNVAANRAVDALLNAGIDDVSIIRNGELDLAVSLGYFTSQSNAVRRRDQVREQGFDAEMSIQRQDESRYWVDYQQRVGVEFASRVLEDFVPFELHHLSACAPTLTEQVDDSNQGQVAD